MWNWKSLSLSNISTGWRNLRLLSEFKGTSKARNSHAYALITVTNIAQELFINWTSIANYTYLAKYSNNNNLIGRDGGIDMENIIITEWSSIELLFKCQSILSLPKKLCLNIFCNGLIISTCYTKHRFSNCNCCDGSSSFTDSTLLNDEQWLRWTISMLYLTNIKYGPRNIWLRSYIQYGCMQIVYV